MESEKLCYAWVIFANQISDFVATYSGNLNVQFVHDGEAPLGTGGAVKNAFYTCGLDGPALCFMVIAI